MRTVPSVIVLLVVPALLAAQGTIRGRVTDTQGRAAPGAIVHLGGSRLGTLVDSNGTYRLDRLPAGTYTVRITRLAFAPESASVAVRDGGTATYDVQLRPSATV